jgi:hypothetical protein
MKTPALTPALALVVALFAAALFAVSGVPGLGGTAHASSTPDSQAAICQAALDKLTSSEQTVNGDYRLGRLHPLFFLGIGGRPDEWVLEYERRVSLFETAFDHAAATCPHFAPYTGPLQGHL